MSVTKEERGGSTPRKARWALPAHTWCLSMASEYFHLEAVSAKNMGGGAAKMTANDPDARGLDRANVPCMVVAWASSLERRDPWSITFLSNATLALAWQTGLDLINPPHGRPVQEQTEGNEQ